jgi:hypothetical protein
MEIGWLEARCSVRTPLPWSLSPQAERGRLRGHCGSSKMRPMAGSYPKKIRCAHAFCLRVAGCKCTLAYMFRIRAINAKRFFARSPSRALLPRREQLARAGALQSIV